MTKNNLFLKLADPDKDGYSRWVSVNEFKKDYVALKFGNGGSWCRKESALAKKYIIEKDRKKTPGNSIDRIRLSGICLINSTQNIKSNIKKIIRKKRCILLGTSKIEVDHKNGRKNDPRVMNTTTQKVDDFQPLSKAANDAKRQHCKECKTTGHRFDATRLGYIISYYKGYKIHSNSYDGCIGCFWYDPIEFRKYLKSI